MVDRPGLAISQKHIDALRHAKLNAREIVYKIDSAVRASRSTYSDWRIGITNDPLRSRKRHQDDGRDTRLWKQWEADSESDARSVEAYFVGKGMKNGADWDTKGNSVYIF
jgi:hypothetical protein